MTAKEIKGKCMEPITDNPVVARLVNYTSHGGMFAAILYAYIGVQPYLAKIDYNDQRHDQAIEWRVKHNKVVHDDALAMEDAKVLLTVIQQFHPELNITSAELEITLNQIKRSK